MAAGNRERPHQVPYPRQDPPSAMCPPDALSVDDGDGPCPHRIGISPGEIGGGQAGREGLTAEETRPKECPDGDELSRHRTLTGGDGGL